MFLHANFPHLSTMDHIINSNVTEGSHSVPVTPWAWIYIVLCVLFISFYMWNLYCSVCAVYILCVQFILFYMCCLHCSICTVYIVLCVLLIFFDMCNLYCSLCAVHVVLYVQFTLFCMCSLYTIYAVYIVLYVQFIFCMCSLYFYIYTVYMVLYVQFMLFHVFSSTGSVYILYVQFLLFCTSSLHFSRCAVYILLNIPFTLFYMCCLCCSVCEDYVVLYVQFIYSVCAICVVLWVLCSPKPALPEEVTSQHKKSNVVLRAWWSSCHQRKRLQCKHTERKWLHLLTQKKVTAVPFFGNKRQHLTQLLWFKPRVLPWKFWGTRSSSTDNFYAQISQK